jgi:hypothetical protein
MDEHLWRRLEHRRRLVSGGGPGVRRRRLHHGPWHLHGDLGSERDAGRRSQHLFAYPGRVRRDADARCGRPGLQLRWRNLQLDDTPSEQPEHHHKQWKADSRRDQRRRRGLRGKPGRRQRNPRHRGTDERRSDHRSDRGSDLAGVLRGRTDRHRVSQPRREQRQAQHAFAEWRWRHAVVRVLGDQRWFRGRRVQRRWY